MLKQSLESKKAFLPLCNILILSHKCWEKPYFNKIYQKNKK
ncbi:hypothetical protein [Spiroplasma endosymbiont of Apeira syringaria]